MRSSFLFQTVLVALQVFNDSNLKPLIAGSIKNVLNSLSTFSGGGGGGGCDAAAAAAAGCVSTKVTVIVGGWW